MNPKKLVTAGLLLCFGCVMPVFAANTVSVDMDLLTPGIQSTRVAAPGDVFGVGLVLSVDANGVTSYGISALFDTSELMLVVPPPAAAVPALPGGLSPLAAPVENNALGQVYSFTGATLSPMGPASTSFTIGTINFKVLTPKSDGLADISLGFFNGGVDGLFDNNGNSASLTFNPGFVEVPEPSTWALALGGSATMLLLVRRRRSNW